MLSVIDSAGTLAYAVGPLFGGILYQLFGFIWSFLAIGLIGLILGFIALFLVSPTEYPQEEKTTNWFMFLRYYKVIFSAILLTNGFALASYFVNILPLYLPKFGVTPIQYGAVYLGFAAIFGTSTLIWSTLANRYPKSIPFIMIIGLLSTGIILLCIAPAKFFNIPPNSGGVTIGILMIYHGTLTTFATQYISMNSYLKDVGLASNLATKSMVSSVALFALAIGSIVALPLSGYIFELHDFAVTATIMGYIQFGITCVFTVYYVIHCCLDK